MKKLLLIIFLSTSFTCKGVQVFNNTSLTNNAINPLFKNNTNVENKLFCYDTLKQTIIEIQFSFFFYTLQLIDSNNTLYYQITDCQDTSSHFMKTTEKERKDFLKYINFFFIQNAISFLPTGSSEVPFETENTSIKVKIKNLDNQNIVDTKIIIDNKFTYHTKLLHFNDFLFYLLKKGLDKEGKIFYLPE